MGAVIFILALATIFLVLSFFLFRGKCSWLIAGYNTMSEEKQAKFDERKICKATGIVTLLVSLLLYVMAFLGSQVESGTMSENQMLPFAIVFIVVILTAVVFINFYINKKCKKL